VERTGVTEVPENAVDWNVLENTMFELAKADIEEFAKSHRSETFYGFYLECNADYGEALLSVNSVEALEEVAHHPSAAELRNREAFRRIDINIYKRMCEEFGDEYRKNNPNPEEYEYDDDPDKRRAELKWSPGDWEYQGFNSARWEKGAWRKLSGEVIEAVMAEEEAEENRDDDWWRPNAARQFMDAACRVVVRLESGGVFNCLSVTPDFACKCADHDEPEEMSEERLASVRREQNAV